MAVIKVIWTCALWNFCILTTTAIIAYDCQDQNMNISTFSLTEIGECKQPASDKITTQEKIQLIQIRDIELVQIIQCKIYVSRLIFYCGMHSHIAAVRNGYSTYIHPASKDMCESMHRYRRIDQFYGKTIDGLIINGTHHSTLLMAGRMVTENSCQGIDYEDRTGIWSNVIVQAAIEITLNEGFAPVKVNENKIILPGGITCPYQERTCIDPVYGYSFWEQVDSSSCSASKYTVIYEGEATRLTPKYQSENISDTTIYTVDKGEKVFAMPIRRPTMICGQSAYETDHPKFYIIKPSESGMFYFNRIVQGIFDIDPTAYTNSKVVFIERHISGQLSKLYEDVILQRCELEQQVLRNLQTLAVTSPQEFAYAKMKIPGYTAVNYGEVVHVIECKPVEVTIRFVDRCFHELPVIFDNKSMFMVPRSHILQKFGTEVTCSPFLYSAFKLHGNWYKNTKGLHQIPVPQILEPSNKNKWTYINPTNLFAGGLYTQRDMIALQQHLVLPSEKQAISGIITRGMVGLETDLQGTNLGSLLTEKTIQDWFQQAWSKAWTWFSGIGLITSGLMGIIVIIKLIKFIVDTIMHGVILYNIFGWSIRLLAAAFDSITVYCLHVYHDKKNKSQVETMDVEAPNEVRCEEPVENPLNLYPKIEIPSTTHGPDWLEKVQ